MVRVLFVCLGNICRSPMAEAVFRDMVQKDGLSSQIEVDSAGIGHWHVGSDPHEGTKGILDQKGLSYEGISARQVTESDWDDFDYLIAMDDQNMRDLKAIREKNDVVVGKLLDEIPGAKESDVPDPYFTGNFDYVYQLVSEGCSRWLERIKNEHSLKEEE
ncbi:low molecular weight phosphotyrosine protein phosphatase [Halobacillus litoralis]|uniref:low molecular weight protein-tyrosine-phosphatase n=1 Tax=Halobacillus litoralis TaxID=45668 RepID=UPI001CD34A51|nr:low molecular weight protein-tyrosine-phosphatase [Halobacillus litoralis]MCA0971928.1 low molecular weight phosphotyrosine protein phosphatase [Halobacillus litoralis]